MTRIRPPAAAPCVTCPYRLDVPSGVWSEDEYEKLPPYDLDTGYQPTGVFMCHTQPDLICSGWCGTHDMEEALSIRLAVANGALDPDDIDAVFDYVSSVPLFKTGAEAAAHGLRNVEQPGGDAVRAIQRLSRRRINQEEEA